MKKVKIALIVVAILSGILAVYYEVCSPSTLVFHPKGLIAHEELELIRTNIGWMLVIILPTLLWLLVTAWRSRVDSSTISDERSSPFVQALLWLVPSSVIVVMSIITWNAAHRLDPSLAIPSKARPLTIQVVALDWKWLFIYPEQHIATLNFFQFPENTPIQFKLTADGTPMNSFWLPEMSGQIYAMTGMVNTLNIMADGPGEYRGRAVEINGEGYADMTFTAKSSSQAEFDTWVKKVIASSKPLSHDAYQELRKRGIDSAPMLYSSVEKDLFDKIVMYYMEPSPTP